MKTKYYLSVLLLYITPLIAFSQEQSEQSGVGQRIKFGIKAGLNLSFFDEKLFDIDPSLKAGFNVGAVLNIPVNARFSLQPEILFSTQGTKYENVKSPVVGVNQISDAEFNYILSYVNIPIMAKINLIHGLHLLAGPQLGFLASFESEVTASIPGGPTITQSQSAPDNSYATFDFALGLGLSYVIIPSLEVESRFNLGLTKINDNNNGGTDIIRNRVLQFGLLYYFPY